MSRSQPLALTFISVLLAFSLVTAQNTTCDIDQGQTRPGESFDSEAWLRRGSCIRNVDSYETCRNNLQYVLDNLDSLHSAEYSAGATVLALLPTVGSLFGLPTAEIWMLFTVLPFGGGLAMLLNFGGSFMPTKLEDYEDDKAGVEAKSNTINDTSQTCMTADKTQEQTDGHSLSQQYKEWLRKRILLSIRTNSPYSQKLPIIPVLVGIFIMALLLLGTLASMAIIEVGAVYMTWCTATWWFHLWWMVVTVVTIVNNWATLPFNSYATVFLSDIHSDYQIQHQAYNSEENGRSLADLISASNLGQLKTLKRGQLRTIGSVTPISRDDNKLMILISIARDSHKDGPRTSSWRYGLQIFLNLGSITIFVFATSIFAAVTLLALPMSQMILMIVVGTAVISRALVSKIVDTIQKQRNFLHIIVTTKKEASEVLAVIFNSQQGSDDSRPYQIEIDGNIFIDGTRVASRSAWIRRILGLMARPYDIGRVRGGYRIVPSEDQGPNGAVNAV